MPTADPAGTGKRIATACLLLLLLAAASYALFFTRTGGQLRHQTQKTAAGVARFVDRHPVATPTIYFLLYVALAVLAMPVWWLQILAGMGFGLVYAVGLSVAASATGATITVWVGRWMAGDWLAGKTTGKVAAFDRVAAAVGHNGLLVVVALRATHVPIPFGLSNYALAVTKISYRDVAVGTFLGNIPAASIYVGIGVYGTPRHHPVFVASVAAINLSLLLPIGLRYLKPQWFKKPGVE